MSKNRLNIGVLGTANIAKRFMLPALATMNNEYSISGVASRTPEKADMLAEQYLTRAFHSYQALVEHPDLDALYIPLPNSLHYHWARRAIENKLHVIVEKSLACSHHDVVELCDLAREHDVALVENFQFRFHSQLDHIREVIRSGEIGEIRNIRSSFGFPPFPDSGNIRYQSKLGGGSLLDAGVYPLKIAQLILGKGLKVKAATLAHGHHGEVDLWGSVSLLQEQGNISAQLSFGFDNYYQCSLEIWGSKGRITTDRIFTSPPDHNPRILIETQRGPRQVELEPDNHFEKMLRHFHKAAHSLHIRDEERLENLSQSLIVENVRRHASEH
jgi:predicted dehydrogenase